MSHPNWRMYWVTKVALNICDISHRIEHTVMYVPPINGSDMRLWKAEMPTNWTVLKAKWSVQTLAQNRSRNLRREWLENCLQHQKCEETSRYWRCGEVIYNNGCREGKPQAGPKCPDPRSKRLVTLRPSSRQPASKDLEREVRQNSKGQIFPA